MQARLRSGEVPEVIPYPNEVRFRNVYREGATNRPPRRPAAPRLQPMSDLPDGYDDGHGRRVPFGRFSIDSD